MKKRRWEFITATVIITIVLGVCWTYIITFCNIFKNTANTWLTSGLVSFAINMVIVQTFIICIHIIARLLARSYENR
jgi:hypothetical protein